MAENETNHHQDKPHCISYVLYYMLMFFSYWFGAARLDQNGDGEFDPSDVEAYLNDKGYLTNNFKQSKTRNAKKDKKEGKSGGPSSSPSATATSELPGAEDPMGFGEDAEAVEGEGDVKVVEALLDGQRAPLFIILECIACFGLWLATALMTSSGNFFQLKAGADWFAPDFTDLRLSTDCYDQRFQAWRWFTYQFTHVGCMHVTMNVFLLVIMGVPLEGLHGTLRMFVMFNVGVFGGACCHFVNDAHTIVVGCSGGCYALIGMHFADLFMNWFSKKFRVATLLFVTLLMAVDLTTYMMSLSSENVSHSAHVGGFIAGIVVGVAIGKNLRRTKAECVFQIVMIFVGTGLVCFCFVWSGLNFAQKSVWEASRGELGYCWWRQVWNYTVDEMNWNCVKCGTQACINVWGDVTYNQKNAPVSRHVCDSIGWYYDDR